MKKIVRNIITVIIAIAVFCTEVLFIKVDVKASTVDYNYAKLLQYSLYFYDANMCGGDVTGKSLLSWRNNCHTYDKANYTRSDGSVVTVDLTGGFHDAGDHVKFGLPEAYAAFVLGMSYDTDKSSYTATGQTGHLKNITTHFADYLVKCTVLSSDGSYVEAFCCQVGQGGGGYDHGYWGAPEAQSNTNRPVYFTSSSAPSTDIVCLSAAALAMQYKNFGGTNYLNTSKKLFEYAKNNNKTVNTTANGFYTSSSWEDDYCLAALMLYKVTGDSQYLTEFNKYASSGNAQKPYWPLGWDNVGPAVAYYNGNSSALSTVMGISNGNSNNGYRCIDDWGSARYNTSMQYTGLLYDKMTSSQTYKSWAEGQMNYILGNNSMNKCFVVGYNDKSAKYPHHRAASGYTGGPQGTTTQAHVLTGALVGGPKLNGSYTDSASDYVCNEVAIDYNATLVAAAAALYGGRSSETDTQYVDGDYYVEGTATAWQKPSTVYNGVDYSAVYDYEYYIAHNADVKAAFGNDSRAALQHFIQYGMAEGRQGCLTFDVYSYARLYVDLRNLYKGNLKPYYMHYIYYGKNENRLAMGVNHMYDYQTVYNGIDYGDVYNYNYYVSLYDDIRQTYGIDDEAVLKHFVQYGMAEGRKASAEFDVNCYKTNYADLRNVYGLNNKAYYEHYIKYGKNEMRNATRYIDISNTRPGVNSIDTSTFYNGVDYSSVYNYTYYIANNPDVKNFCGGNRAKALKHFVQYGMAEGRQGCATFNAVSYAYRYPDLRSIYKNNIKMYYMHYIYYGRKENRSGKLLTLMQNYETTYNGMDYSDVYDYNYYVVNNRDVLAVYGLDENAVLKHFVTYGMKEGRQGKANFNVKNYKARYIDLQNVYGNNYTQYYIHYIKYGKAEGRNGK